MLEYAPVFTALVVIYLLFLFGKYIQKKNATSARILAKQKLSKEALSKFGALLKRNGELWTKERESVIAMSVADLIAALQSGEVSCVDVLHAYQAKAFEVTKELNCVTEFILEAEQWARELDKPGVKKGPLHGVPFSVKDNVMVVGYDCTIGLSKFLNQPHNTDAVIVQVLKELGAIPFCKTNVPQTLLSFGCSNPVWGTTLNPHCKERTSGGSSGGEGCLVAAGGSPFGVGSDIGGSLRAPAAFCGVPSLKPTVDRLSYHGLLKSVKGCVGVDAVVGIIGRDVETVILINRLLLEDSLIGCFDPKLPPIPWRDSLFSVHRKLRVGYHDDDGFFPTTPGVKRSILEAKQKLEALGHELIPFQPAKRVSEALHGFIRIITGDGGGHLRNILHGEPIDSCVSVTYAGLLTPNFIKPFVAPVIEMLSPRMHPIFLGSRGYGIGKTHQLWKQLLAQSELRELVVKAWKEQNLDLCLGPVFACPAPLTKHIGRLVPAGSYSSFYNYTNFPAGIVPVTKETEEDQLKLQEYPTRDLLCQLVKKTTEGAIGLPLCVQIIGLPFQEELILRGMQILSAAINE